MNILRAVPKTQEQENYYRLVMDIAWFGLAIPATDRFLSVYAIHLGADASQLSWLAALPALILMFSASLGNWWVRRYTDSAKAVIWPGFGMRLIFLLPALTPLLPENFQLTWLIISVVVPALPQGIASVAFLVMFREAVNEKLVAPLMSSRFLALNIVVALSALGLGVWLEHAAFPMNYQIMYVAAFTLTLVSLWQLTRIHVLPALVSPPQTQKLHVNPWRSPTFQTVAFIILVTHLTFFSIRPLIPLHLVDNLQAGEGFISLFALAELAAGAGITLVTKQIAERLGHRRMIALSMIGTGLSALIISTTASLALTLIASAINGASWTLVAIGVFAYFSEKTPADAKAAYTTAYSQVVFFAMFLGPIIGNLLNGEGMPLVSIIMVGAVMRILAGLLAHTHPRSWVTRAIHMRRQLTKTTIL